MRIDKGWILDDFIEPNHQQFSVPVYQRNYEWSEEECVKLFNDILEAHNKDKYHFTGSIVFAPLDTKNKIHTYVIIDGQQRLTTIYILIKALIDMADTDSEKDSLSGSVFNTDKHKEYNIDESSKLKLKPVKSDNQQLLLLMENKLDKMEKDSDIYQNYIRFCNLIKTAMAEDNEIEVEDIYDGLQNLTCASIRLEEDDDPQEIFERINSTGIPLTLADKIRNFVLMANKDQDELYEKYWLPAETAVTKEKMTDFLLDFLNIKVDGLIREDEAYDLFKKVFESGKYTNEKMLSEILHYANFYKAFVFGDKKYSEKVNELLCDLQKLKQTTAFLFLFHVFDDLEAGSITEHEVENVLEFLRNYSIRRIICEVNSNSLRGLYKTLYARVFNRQENKQHYCDAMISFFLQLTTKDALPTDEQFIEALEKNNLFRKNALCRYLLISVENQGKEKVETGNLTIEHIMPQNRNLSTAWQLMLGENWQSVHDKYLHTLGNLTLTGYNSELGDKPFKEKKELLANAKSKVVTLYEDVKDENEWNESTILARAVHLSSIILHLFPIREPTTSISFSDPRYQEYSCDDPGTATNKSPNYFELQGERVNIDTFADMLKQVVIRLYSLDRSIIESMARKNEQPLDWSQSIIFSYDKDKVEGEYKIPGTDIYEHVGFSAYYIMALIRAMLDRYDIDHNDFIYSARSTKKKERKEKKGTPEQITMPTM